MKTELQEEILFSIKGSINSLSIIPKETEAAKRHRLRERKIRRQISDGTIKPGTRRRWQKQCREWMRFCNALMPVDGLLPLTDPDKIRAWHKKHTERGW